MINLKLILIYGISNYLWVFKLDEINEILNDFNFLDDWEDKYEYLIDLGKKLPQINQNYKIDSNKLKGCQSTVYFIVKDNENGTLSFFADSDAAIVNGLIAILLKVYSNKLPSEIINISTEFLKIIGLDSHLSPTRKNGLDSMIKRIKLEAHKRI